MKMIPIETCEDIMQNFYPFAGFQNLKTLLKRL